MKPNPYFPEIHGRFAFGCMRLPMREEEIDIPAFAKMVDAFLEAGFNYFDTAHGYHYGKSEIALKEALTSRYPRQRFLLTDKLTEPYFEKREDIRPFFESQLAITGVDYFDFYLMHAQNRRNYEKFKACKAYEECFALKQEGKIHHLGISFHDTPDILDMILSEHPEIEVVQLQFNYLDYEDEKVQSRGCYEVCKRHNKPVFVMEPVKGGALVQLPEAGQKAIDDYNQENGSAYSNASFAFRFLADFPLIACVLSGMSNFDQMRDNLVTMKEFAPLSEKELNIVAKVVAAYRKLDIIPCTTCRYCVTENQCPMDIPIPELFSRHNAELAFHRQERAGQNDDGQAKAASCIECGGCEGVCPQHLPIRDYLKSIAKASSN